MQRKRASDPALITGIAAVLFLSLPAARSQTILHQFKGGSKTIELSERGKPVFTFQIAPKSLEGKYERANYLHPLYDLDGAIVTEDFPADHLHHRGIFWAWHQVLLNGKPVCDPWVCKDIRWSKPSKNSTTTTVSNGIRKSEMLLVRDWQIAKPDSDPAKGGTNFLSIVRESVRITCHPSRENLRILDFDLGFRALVDGVSIGGSDDVKGYGGFSPRIRLSDDVKFISQKGEVKAQNTAVEGGAWMNVVRTLDGKKKSVAILVHPTHPDFPLKWLLRAKRSMQNPQWPGREPIALSAEKETRLRYRLILHTGDLNPERLESLWKEYADGR